MTRQFWRNILQLHKERGGVMRGLIIHNYNIYNGKDELVGDGKEITLPDLAPKTAEIEGSGILGNVKVPVPGMYESLTVDIPFRMLSEKATELFIGRKYATVKIRGGILWLDESTGDMEDKGIVVTARGMGSKLSPGKIALGQTMDSGVSIEAIYFCIEIDGTKVFELDKFNSICTVNGEDILKNLRKLC